MLHVFVDVFSVTPGGKNATFPLPAANLQKYESRSICRSAEIALRRPALDPASIQYDV